MKRPKKIAVADREPLMLPDGSGWDWDRVTSALIDHIVSGGSRRSFADPKRQDTPNITAIMTNIGLDEDRSAKVHAAYRFRAESCADEIIEIRDRVQSGELSPSEARVIIHSLQRDIEIMTNMATKPSQAKAPANAGQARSLKNAIERAVERGEASSEED